MNPYYGNKNFLVLLTNLLTFYASDTNYQQMFIQYSKKVMTAVIEDTIMLGFESPMPEGSYLTIEQQIVGNGYHFEEHKILTDDGYILTAFRIPGKLSDTTTEKNKEVAILQHGLLDSGGTWLFNSP